LPVRVFTAFFGFYFEWRVRYGVGYGICTRDTHFRRESRCQSRVAVVNSGLPMKNPHSLRSATAFTLIELLVVISIIAVLASLSFVGVAGAMLSVKRVQAKNDMAQIVNGVQFYYTEYGQYPVASSGTTDVVFGKGSSANDNIISVLRYTVTPSVNQSVLDNLNPRQIKFLQPKVTDISATVATKSAVNKNSGKWYDPWGTQYLIFIDADYLGDIDASLVFSDITTKPSVGAGAASVGYSFVKQKQTQLDALGSPRTLDKTTDLISWQ